MSEKIKHFPGESLKSSDIRDAKIPALKNIDSTTIREKMNNNEEWKNFVPKEVYYYIKKLL